MVSANKVTCPVCNAIFERTTKQLNVVIKRRGLWVCKGCSAAEQNKSRSKPLGATRINSKGYVLIKTAHGFERLHVLVACAKLGRSIRAGEAVHHMDCDKTNNHPDNIAVLSHGEHSALHNTLRAAKLKEQQHGINK